MGGNLEDQQNSDNLEDKEDNIVGTRHCRLLILAANNFDAAGFDINQQSTVNRQQTTVNPEESDLSAK